MAVDVTLKPLASGYSTVTINSNFEAIKTALDDAVSRSGAAPNQMLADFDMNGNDILNAGTVNAQEVFLGVDKLDVTEFTTLRNETVDAAAQASLDAATASTAAVDAQADANSAAISEANAVNAAISASNDASATAADRVQTGLDAASAAAEAADAAQSALEAETFVASTKWKNSVKAATTANITLSGEQTIDDVSLVTGDRVLVKNQTSAPENGIYIVDAGAWTRATDLNDWLQVPSAVVTVEEGTANADSSWLSTANQGGTIGVSNMPWIAFGGSGGPATSFTGLSDTPSSYTGFGGRYVKVLAGESGLEFVEEIPTFTGLTDTPGSFAGQSGKGVRVNGGATALEFYTLPTIITTFTGLSDTPNDLTGQGGKTVNVNAGGTALEFVDPIVDTDTFTGLTDTPANYTGSANYKVVVNGTATGLEFVPDSASFSNFTDLLDTPSSYSGQAGRLARVNGSETGLEFFFAPYALTTGQVFSGDISVSKSPGNNSRVGVNNGTADGYMEVTAGDNFSVISNAAVSNYGTTDGAGITYTYAGGAIRTTLLANGNFGIDQLTPTEKLDVNGRIKGLAGFDLVPGTVMINSSNDFGRYYWNNPNLVINISGTEVFWAPAISDRSLKENIEPTTVEATPLITALDFKSFTWKKDTIMKTASGVNCGLIAQEAQAVCPDFVDQVEDGPLHLNTNALIMYMGKTIQELEARIAQLENNT